MKLIMINGPSRCGKDTAFALLKMARPDLNWFNLKLSQSLKDMVCRMHGLVWDRSEQEMFKDDACAVLGGKTFRQCCINLASGYLRPTFGKDVLAKDLVKQFEFYAKSAKNVVVVTDVGCPEEVTALVVGAQPWTLLTPVFIGMSRQGTTWVGDSRESAWAHAKSLALHPHWIENDDSLESLRSQLEQVVLPHLEGL